MASRLLFSEEAKLDLIKPELKRSFASSSEESKLDVIKPELKRSFASSSARRDPSACAKRDSFLKRVATAVAAPG